MDRFLSTLSLRRATGLGLISAGLYRDFYPRSPCGERRPIEVPQYQILDISIHALLAESDLDVCILTHHVWLFLSTLSLRRATNVPKAHGGAFGISIHALLAESDSITIITICIAWKFLSTLSLRRATAGKHVQSPRQPKISIHALLAESDVLLFWAYNIASAFLSTLSLRRATNICSHRDNRS